MQARPTADLAMASRNQSLDTQKKKENLDQKKEKVIKNPVKFNKFHDML